MRVASERMEEPVAALDGLRDKGMFVAVPLLADGEHQATFALQVTLPNTRSQRGSLDLLRHVAMEVTVEIGRTRMTVQELLSLHPGEVVELDRAASAPADLLVNGTLIARGEVVVVDEDFGLRISEIVTDAAAELGAVIRMTWMIIRLILSLGFIAVVLLWAARLAKKQRARPGQRPHRGRRPAAHGPLQHGQRRPHRRRRPGHRRDRGAGHPARRGRRRGGRDGAAPSAGSPRPGPRPTERRPAAAPALVARTSTGALAGSVFDRAGWGTFVHQLRERTVRKP